LAALVALCFKEMRILTATAFFARLFWGFFEGFLQFERSLITRQAKTALSL